MADKELLKNVLDSIVNDSPDEAKLHFKKYLPQKMREILGTDSNDVEKPTEKPTE